MMGSVQPFEKEYLRKDGGRVPVLVGVASFEESKDHGDSLSSSILRTASRLN